MDKFELNEKQLDVIRALENLGYNIINYQFSTGSGIGINTYITFKMNKIGEEHTLDITDYDTW